MPRPRLSQATTVDGREPPLACAEALHGVLRAPERHCWLRPHESRPGRDCPAKPVCAAFACVSPRWLPGPSSSPAAQTGGSETTPGPRQTDGMVSDGAQDPWSDYSELNSSVGHREGAAGGGGTAGSIALTRSRRPASLADFAQLHQASLARREQAGGARADGPGARRTPARHPHADPAAPCAPCAPCAPFPSVSVAPELSAEQTSRPSALLPIPRRRAGSLSDRDERGERQPQQEHPRLRRRGSAPPGRRPARAPRRSALARSVWAGGTPVATAVRPCPSPTPRRSGRLTRRTLRPRSRPWAAAPSGRCSELPGGASPWPASASRRGRGGEMTPRAM